MLNHSGCTQLHLLRCLCPPTVLFRVWRLRPPCAACRPLTPLKHSQFRSLLQDLIYPATGGFSPALGPVHSSIIVLPQQGPSPGPWRSPNPDAESQRAVCPRLAGQAAAPPAVQRRSQAPRPALAGRLGRASASTRGGCFCLKASETGPQACSRRDACSSSTSSKRGGSRGGQRAAAQRRAACCAGARCARCSCLREHQQQQCSGAAAG